MPLYIRSEEADQLARELAARTGETITEAVTKALRDRLERTPEADARTPADKLAAMMEIARRSARIPERDPRPHGEILYDENGLPK